MQILFLAASHREGDELALGREVREIEGRIRASRYRDAIALATKLAVRPGDIMQALREHEPHIVHFSGHGTRAGQILLLDDDGDPMPVSAKALARLFAAMRGRTRVVVLNACFSQPQAEAVTEHVDCAIGTSAALSDVGARVFSPELYSAIAHGASVGDAFAQARAALGVHGLREEEIPTLLLRQNGDGPAVDPDRMFLLEPEGPPEARAETGASRAGTGTGASRADTETPPLEPPAPAGIRARLGRPHRTVGIVLSFAALAIVAWALFWPRLFVPRFPSDGGGIVVAVSRYAPEPVRAVHDHMLRALRALGEHHVQSVTLPVLGADELALTRAARDAGASLVVMIEDQGGPRLRVRPIAGKTGAHILEHIPSLPIARAQTREALAPVLFTMSWLAAREPGSLPPEIALPIPEEAEVGRTITVLVMYLRELIDTRQEWVGEAHARLGRMVMECKDARALAAWDCALATYLYYGLVLDQLPEAPERLAAVAAHGPIAIANAAALELMNLRCDDDPDWVEHELARLRRVWGPGHCLRLGLAVPASCLAITHQRSEAWIAELAGPVIEDYAHCGPMPARVLAQRAYRHAVASEFEAAARGYLQAARLAPGDPVYALNWAAVALQQEPAPPELPDRIVDQIDQRLGHIARSDPDPKNRIWAGFLRWLATGKDAHADQLCEVYRALSPSNEPPIPDLGPLGEKLCVDAEALGCCVYNLLTEPKHDSEALCSVSAVCGSDQ